MDTGKELSNTGALCAETSSYLAANRVYELFEHLLCRLMIDQPNDPIEYLIEALRSPQTRNTVLLLPKELQNLGIGQDLAGMNELHYLDANSLQNEPLLLQGPSTKEKKFDFQIIGALANTDKSWLLEGFPRTQPEAYSFHTYGITVDDFIVVMDSATRQKFIQIGLESDSCQALSAVTSGESTVDARYLKELVDVSDVIEFKICEAEAHEGIHNIVSRLNEALNKGKNKASVYPPRISIIGPPLSGKTTQSYLLAKKHGLVCINAGSLIDGQEDEVKREPLAASEEKYQKLLRLLNSEDSQEHGWVMEGFPYNSEHFSMLQEANLLPSLLIQTHIPLAEAMKRFESKRRDVFSDGAESVTQSYKAFFESIQHLPKHFLERIIKIDCNADIPERISDAISTIFSARFA